uniref:Uncharacterized protein n=1 Tax=Aegilops tauschii subsp. strangulata TaxID=200361 RepID=A0A453QN02_AEGTS
ESSGPKYIGLGPNRLTPMFKTGPKECYCTVLSSPTKLSQFSLKKRKPKPSCTTTTRGGRRQLSDAVAPAVGCGVRRRRGGSRRSSVDAVATERAGGVGAGAARMPAPSAQSTATGSKRRPHATEGEQEVEARSRASLSPSLPRVYSGAKREKLQADLL